MLRNEGEKINDKSISIFVENQLIMFIQNYRKKMIYRCLALKGLKYKCL